MIDASDLRLAVLRRIPAQVQNALDALAFRWLVRRARASKRYMAVERRRGFVTIIGPSTWTTGCVHHYRRDGELHDPAIRAEIVSEPGGCVLCAEPRKAAVA